MSDETTRNQATQGPPARDTTEQHGQNYSGQKLDKTLGNIRAGLPTGPEKTPGGHGQVWRDRD